MKMGHFEKRFINAANHGRRVALEAARRLPIVPYRGRLTYLDVGCGNGMASLHLARAYGFDVTGIDIDPEQIRLAQAAAGRQPRVQFLVSDATRLPFPDGQFDVVATNNTTHHILDWKRALAEMLRVLRGGGYFVYGDLLVPVWLARLGRRLAGNVAGFVTRAEIDRFVRDRGLTVVEQEAHAIWYGVVAMRPAA